MKNYCHVVLEFDNVVAAAVRLDQVLDPYALQCSGRVWIGI